MFTRGADVLRACDARVVADVASSVGHTQDAEAAAVGEGESGLAADDDNNDHGFDESVQGGGYEGDD